MIVGNWSGSSGGRSINDMSGYGHHATLSGGTWSNWRGVPTIEHASSSFATVSLTKASLASVTNFTCLGWVRSDGAFGTYSPTWVCGVRSGSSAFLVMANGGNLAYQWSNSFYDWSSGLAMTQKAWHFFAVAVEPTKATLYLKETDGSLRSATNTATHSAFSLSGTWSLGKDTAEGRFLTGGLGGVRMYSRTLSSAEIYPIAHRHVAAATGDL